MPELDPFDIRLAAAIRTFADRAETRVDATDMANRTIGRRRFASLVWLGRPLPVATSILLLLGLLLALLAWSVQVGAPWDQRTSVVPLPAPTASPVLAPTATPTPTTDGVGDEYVNGTGTFSIVDSGTSAQVGDVTQLRGFVATSTDTMNDPRVTGTGTLRLSIDTYSPVGREWGSYRLENAGGAWEGTVTGAAWNRGNASDVSGWLVGSGAYEGYTYFVHTRSSDTSTETEGIIFPGSPPAP
jgi:hypothetical protein